MGRSPRGKSLKPVMLRKVTSSAPSLKYLPASSTGRPRLRTSFPDVLLSLTSYWSPLVTTRSPASLALTSKQAMTLLASPRALPAKHKAAVSEATPCSSAAAFQAESGLARPWALPAKYMVAM